MSGIEYVPGRGYLPMGLIEELQGLAMPDTGDRALQLLSMKTRILERTMETLRLAEERLPGILTQTVYSDMEQAIEGFNRLVKAAPQTEDFKTPR